MALKERSIGYFGFACRVCQVVSYSVGKGS